MKSFCNPRTGVLTISLLLAYQLLVGLMTSETVSASESLFAPESSTIASAQVDPAAGNPPTPASSSSIAKDTEAQIGASAATNLPSSATNPEADATSLLRAPGGNSTEAAANGTSTNGSLAKDRSTNAPGTSSQTNSSVADALSASSATTNSSAPSVVASSSSDTNSSAPVQGKASPASNASSTPPKEAGSTVASTTNPAPKKEVPMIPVDEPPNLKETPDKMAASAPPPVAPSENVTLNLINRLVQRGILTKEDASDLIRQAKNDAQIAAQQAQVTAQASQQAAAAQQMAIEAAAPPSSDESVSVSYVPEIVKTEMKDEIKRDVLAAAQAEGWATPNYPSWINNFRPFMDFRFRYEGDYFPAGNDTNILSTINFNAINTGAPYNVSQISSAQSPYTPPPTYNANEDRTRMRIRFRFGADMNLGDNFTSGFRIGTGQNGSPVSENQSLGAPQNYGNPSYGGNFSGYAIWLDRAFLKYEIGDNPNKIATITFGRFDNPFFTPTTIMWANDIGFDGIAGQGRYELFKGFTPFVSGGIFPIYNTDLNYASTQQPKVSSNDKYLYAAQGGIDWKITKDLAFKGSAGYYYFQNVQGQVSAPGVAYSANDQFNTDNTRPSFAQKGNTYMELRDIQATADNAYGTQNQYQYFGLATPFQIFSANARLEYRHWEPFVVSISGEWDQNMAWSASNIQNSGPTTANNPYNVHGPINNTGANGQYLGGNNAWVGQFKVGSGALQKLWDWDFGVSYRYIESDAVIDGFCDSDFGGGGTNLKGFSVGGNIALSRSVFIGARWLSATQVCGPQFKEDILQIDLNARF